MTLQPCVVCGELADANRCPDHALRRDRPTGRAAGYDTAWRRLSARARRLQPFCSDCGSTEDLTVDHTPEAWRRKDAGLPIRLEDVDVCCRRCNSRRGAARGPSQTRGAGVDKPALQPPARQTLSLETVFNKDVS